MGSNSEAALNTELILGWAFLTAIVILTCLGYFLRGIVPAPDRLDSDVFYILAVVFLVLSLTSIIVARAILMPAAAAKPESLPGAVAGLGYSFAESPAIYGFVLAIVGGKAWIAFPFGVLAFFCWMLVRSYLNGPTAAKRGAEFPRI